MSTKSQSTSRAFPGFNKAYDLSSHLASRPYRGRMELKHPEGFLFLRCEGRPEKPVRITHDMGEPRPKDAFWTSSVVPLIVNQRFIVSGRCGPILYEKSEVIYEDMPGGRFPRYKGEYFDPTTSDGSDFFMPTTFTGEKFVFEPVKEALEKANIRNLLFVRLDEIVLPVHVNTNYKEVFPERYGSKHDRNDTAMPQ